MRQDVQAVVDAVDAPVDPFGHASVSVSVLRQEIPPEVGHEETHLHPHRYASTAGVAGVAAVAVATCSVCMSSF